MARADPQIEGSDADDDSARARTAHSPVRRRLAAVRRRARREEGQALVEMALILPILVVLVLAIAQFGIAFNNYLTLKDFSIYYKQAVSGFLNLIAVILINHGGFGRVREER